MEEECGDIGESLCNYGYGLSKKKEKSRTEEKRSQPFLKKENK